MRPRFEKDIRLYSELAKSQLDLETDNVNNEELSQELDDFSGALKWRLKSAAEGQRTSKEAQEDIFEFQKEKQQIMSDFNSELACLDDPECQQREKQPHERKAYYDERIEGFVYEDDEGKERSATFGELVTDLEWDIDYYLNKDKVPRPLMKKYLLEKVKHDLGETLDQQIIKSEGGSSDVHIWKREAYQRVELEQKTGKAQERAGIISEKMVKNFLKKLSIDQKLPFVIRGADIYQDVEQKIDFIIHREDYLRGVGVEAGKKQDVGIQFSINTFASKKKQRQVARAKMGLSKQEAIQDIVLVIFPKVIAGNLFEQWQDAGRPAGGPDKKLSKNVAEELYRKLLGGVFTEKEIDAHWKKSQFKFREA